MQDLKNVISDDEGFLVVTLNGFEERSGVTEVCPPPQGHHSALSTVLLWGPRGAQFLMSEVSMYARHFY